MDAAVRRVKEKTNDTLCVTSDDGRHRGDGRNDRSTPATDANLTYTLCFTNTLSDNFSDNLTECCTSNRF